MLGKTEEKLTATEWLAKLQGSEMEKLNKVLADTQASMQANSVVTREELEGRLKRIEDTLYLFQNSLNSSNGLRHDALSGFLADVLSAIDTHFPFLLRKHHDREAATTRLKIREQIKDQLREIDLATGDSDEYGEDSCDDD